jgi:AraC-like DNA-binding protein
MAARASENRSEFCAFAPAEAEEYLGRLYGMPVRLARGERAVYWFRHVRLSAPPLHVGTADHTAVTDAETGPLPAGTVNVVRVLRGTRTDTDRGLVLGPGGMAVSGNQGDRLRMQLVNALYSIVTLPLEAIAAATATAPENLPALRFRTLLPASPEAARRWASAARYAAAELRDHPAALARPLAADAMTRMLAVTLLDCFASSWAEVPAERCDHTDATASTLAQAQAYMDANADLPITSGDVAKAAGVTIRAVQLAFCRHAGTTPWKYLRRVRLDRAREELDAAVPGDGTTVTGVAARWGWANADRFTAAYSARFGELPSSTLRRG